MERTVSATQARVRFGEMIQRVVNDQETIIVERSGEPQVVLISLTRYERLKSAELTQGDWRETVSRAREQIGRELNGRELPPAEEIIRQMREERDAQLLDLH